MSLRPAVHPLYSVVLPGVLVLCSAMACSGGSGSAGEPGQRGQAGEPGRPGTAGARGTSGEPGAPGEPGQQAEPAPSAGFGFADLRWNGSTVVEARGYHLTMAGFAFGGTYSELHGPTFSLPGGRVSSDYLGAHEGYGPPVYDSSEPEIWVAAFGVERSSQVALVFAPFLRLTSVSGRQIEIDVHSGALSPGFFAEGRALLCHESGDRSGRVVQIVDNTEHSLTLGADVHLAAGDWILLAPRREGADIAFRYARTLKLDVLPDHSLEWRNFQFSGADTYSYTGNPFGDLRESTYQVIDFRGSISPLAIGVIGTLQVFRLATDGAAASLSLSHDSSNHVVASVSAPRTASYGDGLTVPFRAPLHRSRQELFVRVNDSESVGRLTITGWVE